MYGQFAYVLSIIAVILALTLFYSKRNHLWRWVTGKTSERILIEDTLKHILSCEMGNQISTVESVAASLGVLLNRDAEILDKMQGIGLLCVEVDGVGLTATGREYAVRVIRAHRIWERYLADKAGLMEREWHGQADRRGQGLRRRRPVRAVLRRLWVHEGISDLARLRRCARAAYLRRHE